MASSVAVPKLAIDNPFARGLQYGPGLLLLAAIGYGAKLIEHSINRYAHAHRLVIPNIEYVLWAIVIGFIIGNALTIPKIFDAGIATYEFWLKIGIVLLGCRFVIGDVLKLGGISLILVVIEIAGSLAVMHLLGRLFNLPPKLTSLLSIGSSICGVSAIIAAKGAIEAEDEHSSLAIAAILALGAIALVSFPLIGHSMHMTDQAFGLWSGLAVDNTAEATATGAIYSDNAGRIAVLVKTCRSAMLGFVVLGYAMHWAKRRQLVKLKNKSAFMWQKFPKFVLGFLAISLLVTLHVFSKDQITTLANLSRWAFLLTFAGVGLRTDMRKMLKQGLRPFVVGALGEVFIAVLTLGLVVATNSFGSL